MDDNIRKEYEKILKKIVLERGEPCWAPGVKPPRFSGPVDYRGGEHLRACVIVSVGDVNEDVTWEEWGGTFGDPNRKYGVEAYDVTCACGTLTNRTILWEAGISEVATAVFEEMYKMLDELRRRDTIDE